jgi:hypothetical protein
VWGLCSTMPGALDGIIKISVTHISGGCRLLFETLSGTIKYLTKQKLLGLLT